MALIVWLGIGTWLEMTTLFWKWFIGLSVSLILVYIAYCKYAPTRLQKYLIWIIYDHDIPLGNIGH